MEIQANEVNDSIPQSVQELISTKCTKFDPLWVQVLINLRMKHSKMFTRKRNSASEGWKLVFDELKESGAPEYVTIIKIKKKWMNLMTRYRQIKNTTLNPETITWPYFEQIDRAFGRESEIEVDTKNDTSLNQSISNDEKQNFIKKLIELRYNHRHLFTGRKYTARDGWLIIQSLLQCHGKYSIDQLSKCWQNLVQRYKQLAKHKTNENITWPYFEYMNKWFKEDNKVPEMLKLESEGEGLYESSIVEGEDKKESRESNVNPVSLNSKGNISIDCIIIQLLTEIKTAQEKLYKDMMVTLTNINENLNNINSCNNTQFISNSET